MARFTSLISRIDDLMDRRRMARRARRGQRRPVEAWLYRGWVGGGRLHIRGRVVERPKGRLTPARADLWSDLRTTLRRFLVTEIMGATVRVSAGGAETVAITDSDGYFTVELPAPEGEGWLPVHATLEDFPGRSQPPKRFEGFAFRPPAGPGLAIVSDLDDTVIRSGIAEPLRNLRTLIAAEAGARVTYPGLPALYRGLADGGAAIAYVSSGAWNLYDLIEDFLALNEVPPGPMFFDQWGVEPGKLFTSGHLKHKRAVIEQLLAGWPEREFVLVGDSGQHDATIYARIAEAHPGRVRAVWIRDVHTRERREDARRTLLALREAGTAVFVEPHLLTAAEHAARQGWIGGEALAAARTEVAAAD